MVEASVEPFALVDTHCHLNHPDMLNALTQHLADAQAARVIRLVVVGYDLETSRAAVDVCRRAREGGGAPGCYAAVGIHPHAAESADGSALSALAELAAQPEVVAIGEIGLDYHYPEPARDVQHAAFSAQLQIAAQLGLPFIVHCREAYDDTLDTLDEISPGRPGVMHCWAGTVEQAARAVSGGLWLGFGGIITFKNADTVRSALLATPRDRVVLETDSPYLAPAPYRGKQNCPAYTRLVAEKVAELLGTTLLDVAEFTSAAAEGLFPRMMVPAQIRMVLVDPSEQ